MPAPWPDNAYPDVIGVASTNEDSLTWTVPSGVLVSLEAVYAEIDPGADDVTAVLVVRDQSGVVIARKSQSATLTALISGSATWALRLADETADVFVGALVSRATAQSIASSPNVNTGTPTLITFVTRHYDPQDMSDFPGTFQQLTVREAGVYHVAGTVNWDTTAADAGPRMTFVYANGGALNIGVVSDLNIANRGLRQVVSGLNRFEVGDEIQVAVVQESGANKNVTAASLACARVGPYPA